MTAPMPETMSPREKVARAVYDTVTRFDGDTVGTHLGLSAMIDAAAPTVDDERRIVKSVCDDIADSILTALASGSGDHAGLKRLADEAADFGVPAKVDPAVLNALIAEVAALREECRQSMVTIAEGRHRAEEAERKLAEAVGLNDRAADLMRQCTDPERFEGVSTLNVYANMRAWLSDLPPAPGAEA